MRFHTRAGLINPTQVTSLSNPSRRRRGFRQATAYVEFHQPFRRPSPSNNRLSPWVTNSQWVKQKLRKFVEEYIPPTPSSTVVGSAPLTGHEWKFQLSQRLAPKPPPQNSPPPAEQTPLRPSPADVQPGRPMVRVHYAEYEIKVWIGEAHECFVYLDPVVGHAIRSDILRQLGFRSGSEPRAQKLGLKYHYRDRCFFHKSLSLPRLHIDSNLTRSVLTMRNTASATLWMGGRWHAVTLNGTEDDDFERSFRDPHYGLQCQLQKLKGP
ncbi:hypothetical protein XA68_10810 [Ophiocordyceps unilateralis]|uniref:Uncharacterized protein n=1 Tax=Ophiocordyceps unilateralis TaxID=268505 RepID=A0A2A9PI14_OPHUN|nr:hypothetical protein XA68_10810 [Ophiocordyceps unilateralis]